MIYFLYLDAMAFCDLFERERKKVATNQPKQKNALIKAGTKTSYSLTCCSIQCSNQQRKNKQQQKQKQIQNDKKTKTRYNTTKKHTDKHNVAPLFCFHFQRKIPFLFLLCLHKAASRQLMTIVRHNLCLHILPYICLLVQVLTLAPMYTVQCTSYDEIAQRSTTFFFAINLPLSFVVYLRCPDFNAITRSLLPHCHRHRCELYRNAAATKNQYNSTH